ncbi:hypothetical protein BDF20DRAFT_815956 [Mycotypha africana]|uniref:uncharacterized protein n=1 Tax=Mycotypha africana TaxID=64632 RepID=UPI0022FFEB57|nr:uncharacterized protein BDF20DRAFT_815956 [Mycotypha africana]KAI8984210.1 hypothetical protein BDF20DRAFT_815956 [Mycotypha africana]
MVDILKKDKTFTFTEAQRLTLLAIMDTFVAPLSPQEKDILMKKIFSIKPSIGYNQQIISAFCDISGSSSSLNVIDRIEERLQFAASPKQRQQFLFLLNMLSHQPTLFLLTGGRSGILAPSLKDLSQKDRERVLLSWKKSSFSQLRMIYNSFMGLCLQETYFGTESLATRYINTFTNTTTEDTPLQYCSPWSSQKINKTHHKQQSFDAIVVGSGAGGGVAAAELAKAGLFVLLIEKGTYFHQDDLQPDNDRFAFFNMYDNGGITPNAKGTVNLMSGSTFGGGTSFAEDLQTVCDRIGVSTKNVHHNGPNQKLLNGCRALGYSADVVPQNTYGRAHYCGKCYTGCASGIKNSTVNTWLKDAAAHGAKFLDRTRVTRILCKNEYNQQKKKKAIGVVCQLHGDQNKEYTIHAKFIIVAGGALHTPCLLRRSGLQNTYIGKDLRLHLATLCIGVYDEVVNPSEGTLLTVICNEFEKKYTKEEEKCHRHDDGSTYGYKIECFTNGTGLFSGMVPWEGAAQHKELMLRYRNTVTLFAMLRDKDSACNVEYDKDDPSKVDVQFQLSQYDGENLKDGLVELAKIHVAAGARKVLLSQHPFIPEPTFEFLAEEETQITNPRFVSWLELIKRSKPPVPASGHQMSSCRMGTSPNNSVTEITGETWDAKNLYIADSSLFPTALGVNPMVTIEAISLSVTKHIIRAFKEQEKLPLHKLSKL